MFHSFKRELVVRHYCLVAVVLKKMELTQAEKHVHDMMRDKQYTKEVYKAQLNIHQLYPAVYYLHLKYKVEKCGCQCLARVVAHLQV